MNLLALILTAATMTSAWAFDFNIFPGQYQLMKEGSLQGNCPSQISIVEDVPGARKFHAYNLDLTVNEARVEASILLDEIGKGWVSHHSAGEKTKTHTIISENNRSELIWTVKGRYFVDEDNRIPAPLWSFHYFLSIVQDTEFDNITITQQKLGGRRVLEDLKCVFKRLK